MGLFANLRRRAIKSYVKKLPSLEGSELNP